MTILIDAYHPANYLILRKTSTILKSLGHKVIFSGREKDVLTNLLAEDGNDFVVPPSPKNLNVYSEFFTRDKFLRKLIKSSGVSLALGASASVAIATLNTKVSSIVFNDDDPRVIPQFVALSYPFANKMLTPEVVPRFPSRNLITYPSYHALAYLHPNIFTPNIDTKKLLGVHKNSKYFIIRNVALKAFHDKNERGLSKQNIWEIIEFLRKHGEVFVSSENLDKDFEDYQLNIPRNKIHDVLAGASLLVSDSQSMTSEAAVLGVPSVRINTFVKRISYLNELEEKFKLTSGFIPENFEQAFKRIQEIVVNSDSAKIYQRRKDFMLNFRNDPTDFFISQILSELKK